jgi:hypothetical protein
MKAKKYNIIRDVILGGFWEGSYPVFSSEVNRNMMFPE